jgi:hypothetical protein
MSFGYACSAQLRGAIQLVRKHAHANRDGDAFDTEERNLVLQTLPIEARPGINVFVNQVSVTLSRTSSRVTPSGCPSKEREIISKLRAA